MAVYNNSVKMSPMEPIKNFFFCPGGLSKNTVGDCLQCFQTLRSQTVCFAKCMRISQQGRSLCSSFVLSFSLIVPTKILKCLKTCLWNPGTYRHKIVRPSSAQFGLVMNELCDICVLFLNPFSQTQVHSN